MNSINCIYTTVSGGRLHIAADAKHVGTIDSYNNCFSQFFAWLFCRSMTVIFDGKARSVNKQSYTHLIQSLNKNDQIKDIYNRSVFRSILETATLPTGNVRMRDVITSQDRNTLFRKLSFAIAQGDTTKAMLMIGKGAEVDTAYYDRGTLPLSFTAVTSNLGNSRYTFTAFRGTPILQAARKGNQQVCQFLKDAGANLSIIGEQCTVKREITSVNTYQELVYEPELVPHHHHSRDAKGRDREIVRHEVEYQPQWRKRTIVNTQDTVSNWKTYRLNLGDLATNGPLLTLVQ